MMTLSMQRKFTFNSLLEVIRGSKCCVIKVRQYSIVSMMNMLEVTLRNSAGKLNLR